MGRDHFLRPLAWNIDNYYMIPLLVVIVGASVLSVVVAFLSNSGVVVGITIALFVLHAIPAFMATRLAVLNTQCRLLLDSAPQDS